MLALMMPLVSWRLVREEEERRERRDASRVDEEKTSSFDQSMEENERKREPLLCLLSTSCFRFAVERELSHAPVFVEPRARKHKKKKNASGRERDGRSVERAIKEKQDGSRRRGSLGFDDARVLTVLFSVSQSSLRARRSFSLLFSSHPTQ